MHVDTSIFEAILAHFPFAFVRVGRDGVVRKAGGAGLRRPGIDPADAEGRPVRELMSPEIEKRVLRAVDEGPQSFQTTENRNGARLSYSHFVFYHRHEDEIIGIAVDISDQVAAQEALQRSEAKYRTLFENASDAIFLFEINEDRMPSRIIEVNNVAVERLGYSKAEFADLDPAELDAPEFEIDVPDTMEALYRKGKEQIEFLHVAKDGTRIPVEVSSHLVRLDGQDYLLSIARDITERREYERRLHASIEEKEVLLREIHHRVKNNLQIVSSMLHMEASRQDEVRRDAVTVLRETQSRVQAMSAVHEVIYSVGTVAHVNLGEYLPRLVDSVRGIYMGAGSLHYRVDCAPIEVELDQAVPMGLLVNEAITNAVKHAFPEEQGMGTVALRVTKEDGEIRILVADDGVGLPEGIGLESRTIGMMLMQTLSSQLKARARLLSRPTPEERAALQLPDAGSAPDGEGCGTCLIVDVPRERKPA